MMVLNNLFPVFALILFGVLLRGWRLTDDVFLKTADKLTYYIFFPLLLFWKIGGASTVLFSNSGLYKAVFCTVFAVYVLSTIFIILFKMSLVSSVFKLLVLPVTGYLFLMLFGVSGFVFKVGLIYFALPTSSALYILSSQLNSDTDLASASIALSTILSFFSLSIVLLL
jgi:predicted permease